LARQLPSNSSRWALVMDIVGARGWRPTSAASLGHARPMIGLRYFFRLPPRYAGKKSGKHRLHRSNLSIDALRTCTR